MMIRTPIVQSNGKSRLNYSGVSVAPAPARAPARSYGAPVANGNKTSNGKPRSNGKRKKRSGRSRFWSPWKLIMYSVLFGVLGFLYLTHVFQTQSTLREVQQLRRDYERAERLHTDARRNYDRMTGPAEVYRRAESLGMVSGGAVDPVITINN